MAQLDKQDSPSLISSYWLDDKYRIVNVGAEWDSFAIQNDGEELISSKIVGQKLFPYITSESTRMYVRLILDHVRNIEHEAVKPYRCDSPTQKRFMEMKVDLEDEGVLRLDHYIVSTEEICPPVRFRQAEQGQSSFLMRCSMCNKINIALNWYEPNAAYDKGLIVGQEHRVLYTVCDSCKSGFRSQRDALIRGKYAG